MRARGGERVPPRGPRARRARDSPCTAAGSTARRRRPGRRRRVPPCRASPPSLTGGREPVRTQRSPATVYYFEMAERAPRSPTRRAAAPGEPTAGLPLPTQRFRRQAWLAFQRALDPLAPPKPLPPAAAPRRSRRLSVTSRPSSSMLSNSPGEIFEPVTATPDRLERLRAASGRARPRRAQRRLDRRRRRTARARQRLLGRASIGPPPSRAAGSGSRRRRGNPRSRGTPPAARSSPARAAPRARRARRPSRSRSRRARARAVRELVRRELAEVDAVHPVELLVVELGRAR